MSCSTGTNGAGNGALGGQAGPKESGFDVLLHYLDVPIETSIARLLYRTSVGDPVSHEIDEAGARHFAGIFEPPTVAEGLNILLVERDRRPTRTTQE